MPIYRDLQFWVPWFKLEPKPWSSLVGAPALLQLRNTGANWLYDHFIVIDGLPAATQCSYALYPVLNIRFLSVLVPVLVPTYLIFICSIAVRCAFSQVADPDQF